MSPIDEAHISVRFKHGIHTVFLFVDTLAPFASTTHRLAQLLCERYPTGLTTSIDPPKKTPISPQSRFVYGVLNVPTDPSKGWRKLDVGDDDEHNALKCGLKNNGIVAFAVGNDDGDDINFQVEWPREEEGLETSDD
ncbi:hypothetical protein CDD81_7812 [Ophiocordyceps australis]|uniref:Uncharacterized protein n=1 Tax=Ophiocordyceps australis TaxID=1399860 RepID=A0A2C5XBJ8_9HYPO|nr:hypothetical protein CDD81_7812 [Ophiocordyceps australis]